MAVVEVQCPLCQTYKVVKFGTSPEGKQRYQCQNNECQKNTFLLEYTHKGYLSDIKQKIIDMSLNGNGIRDISRILGISENTVISELKKKKQKLET